jgi:hypothetical protein
MDYQKTTDQLLNEHRYLDLINACREALEEYPEDAELHYKLAWGLEHTHRIDEARDSLDRVLHISPGHVHALLTLAKLDKRSGDLETARTRLEELQLEETAPQHKCAVLAELGDVYDRMGDYSRAFGCFQASNQEIFGTIDPKTIRPNAIFNWINNYQRIFTSQYMDGWNQVEPEDEHPDPVFLVGFPRSGTTLTEQIITASGGMTPTDEQPLIHELIRVSPRVIGRQLRYPAELDTLDEKDISKLRRQYWTLAEQMVQLDTSDSNKRLLDKLPLNLIELGFIHRIFPKAQVIVVLRDPRDCCLSCFMNYFVPNDAMIHFLDLGQSAKLYSAVMNYWLHLRSFIKQPLMEIHYEDIVSDFSGTLRPLIDFLGLEWSDAITDFHKQAGERDVRTPSYREISQPISSRAVGRWKNYSSFMGQVREPLAPFIREFGYDE